MPIPKEILAIERPKSTRVKKSGDRYLVIKRTSKYVQGRSVPVDLGTIGEIIGGKYVEIRKEPRKKKKTEIDIKDYGETALCSAASDDLLQELANTFDIESAKRLFVIALLRASDPDIRNRDIQLAYDTSFLSETIPGVHLSENTISEFLKRVGMEYRYIRQFMQKRIDRCSGKTLVIDGTLKDNNSITNTFSEYSRKGTTKGSKDISLVYAYDLETREPVAVNPYQGNMLDLTSFQDFVDTFKVRRGLLVMDKGFYSKDNIKKLRDIEGLNYIIPMKQSAALIKKTAINTDIVTPLTGYKEATVFYKKLKVNDQCYLYAFRDPRTASEQEIGYVAFAQKKGSFSTEKLLAKQNEFGIIVFESKSDLNPLEVYSAYASRWEIEVMFNLFKDILDLDTVNVHGDYRAYATEFINYLSIIIATRVKSKLKTTILIPASRTKPPVYVSDRFSFRQVLRYLSKCKKIRIDDGSWIDNKRVKYILELSSALNL